MSSPSPSSSDDQSTTKSKIFILGVTCDPAIDPSPSILTSGIQDLFQLYFNELYDLGCDLGFQGFQNEWIDLPGKYCFNNGGGIYVAVEVDLPTKNSDNDKDVDDQDVELVVIQPGDYQNTNYPIPFHEILTNKEQVIGCIAIRSLSPSCGELKRMYIRSKYRKLGIGKRLAKVIMKHGFENCMYDELKLDSLERLVGAVKLYEGLGFSRMKEPYCECPEDDHVCMNLFKKAD